MQREKTGLLRGSDEVAEFLDMSKPLIVELIKIGLPVRIEKGRWWAHKENLENWLRRWTNTRTTEVPENGE